ncbi:MAG TPA: hypothetical protein VNC62_07760 [Burkholderiales bacterium]|nr:hypothetical protein [Burkholderiales bacterium]
MKKSKLLLAVLALLVGAASATASKLQQPGEKAWPAPLSLR